jgi:hypothetical protein
VKIEGQQAPEGVSEIQEKRDKQSERKD